MKTPSRLLACLAGVANAVLAGQAAAGAATPEPREIPVPFIAAPLGRLPGPAELPSRPEMPDVLQRSDGTRVTSPADWPARRQEILRTLEYYAVGQAPPAPGNVRGQELARLALRDGAVTYRRVRLSFGPEGKLGLEIGIFTPAGNGPFPAVISPSGTPPGATPLSRLPNGPTQGKGTNVLFVVGGGEPPAPGAPAARGVRLDPETIAATNPALARGYAYVVFNYNDCGEDTTLREADGSWSFRRTRFFPAYPGYDWGLLRAWAWGVSRIVDHLVTDPVIDRAALIVTGVSHTGKSAMVAAAFDDRLALGAPAVTGGGGVGAYRFVGPRRSETLDVMLTKYPNWFSPQLHPFRGQRERLPFDQHWFLAACAPRAFLALEGDADVISLPEAVRQSIAGARPAFALLGATDRLGVHYAPHGHTFNDDDWAALLDFADWHLRAKPTTRRFDHFPSEAELDAALQRPAGPTRR